MIPSETKLVAIARISNFFEKQGFSVAILVTVLYINYTMLEDQNSINEQNNKDIRKEIQDCRNYSRDILQELVRENTVAAELQVESNKRIEKLLDKLDK